MYYGQTPFCNHSVVRRLRHRPQIADIYSQNGGHLADLSQVSQPSPHSDEPYKMRPVYDSTFLGADPLAPTTYASLTMKFLTVFSLAAAVSLFSVAALSAYPLEARAPTSLSSHLHSDGTCYRAITGGELAHATTIYKKGQHPASYTTAPGDSLTQGGCMFSRYVFTPERNSRLNEIPDEP